MATLGKARLQIGSTPDVIHDVCYDWYGRRMATSSSDQSIRVYDEVGQKESEWKAHAGSIWRLAWAHPEFGPILASCSFDRKIIVWEERTDAAEALPAPGRSAWRARREIAAAHDSVTAVQFAPRRWGLVLASCSADRYVRIHEAPDPMDLTNWLPLADFEVDANRANAPQCLAWNPSSVDAMSLVVGTTDGSVAIWVCGDGGTWARAHVLEKPAGGKVHAAPRDRVNDVAWAADIGRAFHLVASASRDKSVKVWTIQRDLGDGVSWGAPELSCELPHHSQAWRAEWNACGAMLATSVDDGTIRLYRMDATDGWNLVRPVPVPLHQ